ncbi:hypothetical protein [Actinomadura sp. NBRC 104425]|uniref:hypothetical protein n=1 Tax=Actinomadura sp. NBRC 104425 TaxID=3032204 RepID=UPI002556AACE|nr:hypothetical protein [Actinomadura sp. NBRC 104425]
MISRLLAPHAVVTRRTAAWIWELDVLPPGVHEWQWDVELMWPGRDLPPDELPAEHIVEQAGVRVTSMARTALDCARWLPRLEAVAALDQFLRRGVDPASLAAMARDLAGRPNARRLRDVLRLGDGAAASPGESWTRVMVVDAGFPRPRTQIPVAGPYGEPLFVDLGYEQLRVGLEYDGERHHSGARARAHDERRRRWLRKEMGWEIIPVTKGMFARPAPYLEALLTALLQRGWTPGDATLNRIATRLDRRVRTRRTP